jgi:putative endonuclease
MDAQPPARSTTTTAGAAAEALALRHLQAQGLRLLQRNWRTRGGELDLVMEDGEDLVIAEVRARSRADFGGAAASIDSRKRGRIVNAARAFLAAHPRYHSRPVRFDIVAIEPGGRIDWIRNAFDAED